MPESIGVYEIQLKDLPVHSAKLYTQYSVDYKESTSHLCKNQLINIPLLIQQSMEKMLTSFQVCFVYAVIKPT